MKSIEADYHRDYYRRNRAKWKVYSKRDYTKRREAIAAQRADPERRARRLAYLKAWRASNVEKRREAMRQWQSKNRDYIIAYRKNYGPRRRALYLQNREQMLIGLCCSYRRFKEVLGPC